MNQQPWLYIEMQGSVWDQQCKLDSDTLIILISKTRYRHSAFPLLLHLLLLTPIIKHTLHGSHSIATCGMAVVTITRIVLPI